MKTPFILACALLFGAAALGQGFIAADGPAEQPNMTPLTPAEQARYNRVAQRLIESINRDDGETYRSLFTQEGWDDAIPWFREMFREQLNAFGRIDKGYGATRGVLRFGKRGVGTEYRDGAEFGIEFEDPAGGVIAFELDENDKIVFSSVYIASRMVGYEAADTTLIYDLEHGPIMPDADAPAPVDPTKHAD